MIINLVNIELDEHWLPKNTIEGPSQLQFLITQGLLPQHRLLDIGINYLQCGINFISYLDNSNYFGIDDNLRRAKCCKHLCKLYTVLSNKQPNILYDRTLSQLDLDIDFQMVVSFKHFCHKDLSALSDCVEGLKTLTSNFFVCLNIADNTGSYNTLYWTTVDDIKSTLPDCNIDILPPLSDTSINMYNTKMVRNIVKISW